MKLRVTETESLEIQQVLIDLLHAYNQTLKDDGYDLATMVSEHAEMIEEIFEQDPLSKFHKEK